VSKLLMFLKRKPGTSLAEFRAYYEDHHVPLCMKYMAGPVRYLRRFVDHPPGLPELDFDVITEVWFKDRATRDVVIDFNTRDAMPADVIADEHRFLDRTRSRFCAVEECETELG
jgi:hypothetical protein